MTVLEIYDVCLTNPQISGMLHSVHALVEGNVATGAWRWRRDQT
jgi:hypothetical protein